MKILCVTGDDYAALSFEIKHGGTPVIDVINNLNEYLPSGEYDDDENQEGYWELSVEEVEGEVTKSFIDFVKAEWIMMIPNT